MAAKTLPLMFVFAWVLGLSFALLGIPTETLGIPTETAAVVSRPDNRLWLSYRPGATPSSASRLSRSSWSWAPLRRQAC
jgi:hypothetical protein